MCRVVFAAAGFGLGFMFAVHICGVVLYSLFFVGCFFVIFRGFLVFCVVVFYACII